MKLLFDKDLSLLVLMIILDVSSELLTRSPAYLLNLFFSVVNLTTNTNCGGVRQEESRQRNYFLQFSPACMACPYT